MRAILTLSIVISLTTISLAGEPVNCSECHGSSPERYTTKKIRFMDKVTFIHNTHYMKKNLIEGVDFYCTTCHQRQTRHFDASKETCFLCHFKNNEFNKKMSRCSLCHQIPAEPLQRQMSGIRSGEEPITHASLDEAKVSCQSCHLEIVKGTGNVNRDKCLYCHPSDDPPMVKAENPKVIHAGHVPTQKALCFDCHEPIEHKGTDFLEVSRNNCQACHPNHHIYQVKLLAGDITQEVPKTPGLMFAVKTNCMGCHIEADHDKKGEETIKGSAKACIGCHTERHKAMLKEWKDKINEELEAVEEARQQAEGALKKAQKTLPEEKLREPMALFEKAQEFVNTVRYGNGVHNKKYSITLIDLAFGNFEKIVDMLNDEELEITPGKE